MTSEVTQAALEPCPFCGHRTVGMARACDDGWWAECNKCGASRLPEKTEQEAIAAWNTRLTAQSGEGRKLFCETCGDDVHEVLCPKCAKWWEDNSPSEGRSGAWKDTRLHDIADKIIAAVNADDDCRGRGKFEVMQILAALNATDDAGGA